MKNLFELLQDYLEAADSFDDMWNNDTSATVQMLKDERRKFDVAEQIVKQYINDNGNLFQLDF